MAKKNKRQIALNDTFRKDPTWYKDAVIYQVHVKSYFDSNDDGVGDFEGLISKLDYIADLGVTAIWLLPFYPSPMRDDGYDIAEYCDVYPPYGSLADARRFIKEAHNRGMRVITEMVINHTSDQHPWFQRARAAKKNSKARNLYVWSDTNQKYEGTRIIFSDTENSNWTWDPLAGQYFWHRFYSNQPDLNFDNPDVLKEVMGVMRYWFDMGVDGLRLDAIPYLVEREGTSNENLPETHDVIKKIRAELDEFYPDRMLLAEANLWPEDIQQYFGNGDECHMAFHFPLMPRMYMAIAQEDRFPIIDILRQMPEIPPNCQWAIFLRNHDELTLEMVTDEERDYLWNFYAADKRARINLGIRRRLAPLVERDRRRIELLNSLLLSMPGTPTIYYGDEIGMGDNIFLGDRHGVRTPMQWSTDRNGGFSRADPASLVLPATMDPLYGFQAVNVEAQARDTHSLLNWTRRMLAVRKQQKAFGRGNLKILAPANRRILAYLREYTNPDGATEIILCVANMSRAAQAGEFDLSAYAGKIPVEMIGGTSFPLITQMNYLLTLQPYGFYWFLLADETQMPSWYIAPIERMPELPTLIIKQGILDLIQTSARTILEKESLPAYLSKSPWYSHPGEPISDLRLRSIIPLGNPDDLLSLVEVEVCREDHLEYYHIPLAFVADHLAGTLSQKLALARLRKKRTAGILTDAFTVSDFSRKIIYNFRHQSILAFDAGEIQFIPTSLFLQTDSNLEEDINLVTTKDSNYSVIIGESLVLKPIRRVIPGVHPDIEISYFLSKKGFNNIASLLGEVRRVDKTGEIYTLIILQNYINNQGDAWQWTQNTLERALRDQATGGSSSMDIQYPPLAELETFASVLGQRLGEMHLLLAEPSDDAHFGYADTTQANAKNWVIGIGERMQEALDVVTEQSAYLSNKVDSFSWLLTNAKKIVKCIKSMTTLAPGGIRLRVHGNLNLEQILVVRGDAYFINFEDGVSGSLIESDLRHSPLKDVADILCSFDDAAAIALRTALSTDVSSQVDRIREIVTAYQLEARSAFYDTYRLATEKLPKTWRKTTSAEATLKLLCIDNRVREILKARHRSESLEIPLQGLVDICRQMLNSEDMKI